MEETTMITFSINRVFYSYDIPGGESRGAHAHRHCHQFIVAASGSFEVALDDGVNKRTVTACMFHLGFGRQNRVSHREASVWYWLLKAIRKMTISGTTMSS